MTPSPPLLPKRSGERAAGTEMFFTPPSAQELERGFFLTGASTTGARAPRTRRGTWSSTTMGQFAAAGRRAASRRWLLAHPSQRERGRGLRKLRDENL